MPRKTKTDFFEYIMIVVYIILTIVTTIYILNPTAGILELIPDNIPVIGNLDEAGATILLMNSLKGIKETYPK